MITSIVSQVHVTTEQSSTWALLVQYFGVPGAMLVVILFALSKGWLTFGRENAKREAESSAAVSAASAAVAAQLKLKDEQLELIKSQREQDLKWWQDRYNELKAEATTRLDSLRTEKDMWRETAMKTIHIATDATQRATGGKNVVPPAPVPAPDPAA